MTPISDLTDEELLERLHGLSLALFFSDGKLYVPSDIGPAFWETFNESKKRSVIPPLEVERLIDPSDPAPIFHFERGDVVRYGSLKRLNEFLAGKVTFTRADVYQELQNDAQRDDEMARHWRVKNQTISMANAKYKATKIKMTHSLQKLSGEPAHYYMLCFSLEESRKLQEKFNYDGYVQIHDYRQFYAILKSAVANKYGAIGCSSGQVSYYDDLEAPAVKCLRDLVFTKKNHYTYQREVRIALLDVATSERHLQVEVVWPLGLISEIKSFRRIEKTKSIP